MGEDASRFEEKIKQFKDNWSKDDPLWIWFRKVSERALVENRWGFDVI